MQTLTAHYDIVTPMFIGGGHRDDPPEIRPPSVKGALRFWWRALQWGECLKACDQNVDQALQHLHEQEAALFGLATKEKRYGQGNIQLRVQLSRNRLNFSSGQQIINNPSGGLTYLLGQGLYHFRNGFLASALDTGQHFEVILKIKNNVEIDCVIKALMLFGLLGGLGSRSRKGWGSVAIRSLIHQNGDQELSLPIPDTLEAYVTYLKNHLSALPTNLPPYTAFSEWTRIDISQTGTEPLSVLGQIGAEMQLYRSYGRNGGNGHQVNGITAEQNFKSDHDLILDFANHNPVQQHPERVVFGLPHNYFFSNGTKVDVNVESQGHNQGRRASPLFIHTHQFSNQQTIGVQALIPAQFIPSNKKIQLDKSTHTQTIPCHIDWDVLTRYLDRFNHGVKVL